MDKIKAFFADYKDQLGEILNVIVNFVTAILKNEFKGEAFEDIL